MIKMRSKFDEQLSVLNQKLIQMGQAIEKNIQDAIDALVNGKRVDLIIGGPPCQAYSIHGRAQDKNSMRDDYRNYLFESFIRVVSAFQPDVFVFENVTGILSAKPGGRHVTERIYEAFTNAGYEIREPKDLPNSVFDAVKFGVPQYRRRVIIIGVRSGVNKTLSEFYSSIANEQLDTPEKNIRTNNFYIKLGYKKCGFDGYCVVYMKQL